MALDAFTQVVAETTTRAHCSGSGWWMGGMAIWWVSAYAVVVFALFWLVRESLGRRSRGDQNALAIAEQVLADDELRRSSGHSSTDEGHTG